MYVKIKLNRFILRQDLKIRILAQSSGRPRGNMLKSLQVDNFKCFNTKTSIEFSKLTILSGLNSSGKSSVYQALIGLWQSDREYEVIPNLKLPVFCTYGKLLKLGTIEDVFNDFTKPFYLNFQLNEQYYSYRFETVNKNVVLTKLRVAEGLEEKSPFYQITYDLKSQDLKIKARSALSFTGYHIQWVIGKYLSEKGIAQKDEDHLSDFVSFQKARSLTFKNQQLHSFVIPVEELINCINPEIRKRIDELDFIDKIGMECKREKIEHIGLYVSGTSLLDDMFKFEYIPPDREKPRRYYELSLERDDGMNNILSIAKDTSIKIPYRYVNGTKLYGSLSEAITFWSNYILGIEEIEQDYSIEGIVTTLLITQDGQKHPINMVGYGISQALPVIMRVLAFSCDFYVVDEPEIHLHPQAQIRFAQFFKEMAILGKQIIVETHSEYIINYLIYESLITEMNNLVRMYWVKKEGTDSSIENINWDEYGFVDNRPEGFSDGMHDIAFKLVNYRSGNNS